MRTLSIFFLSNLFCIAFTQAQNSVDLTLSAGYTAIDLEKVVEKDEISGTQLEDWDQANFGFSAQYFFTSFNDIQFGLEAMYQHMYWYRVLVPFGSSTIDREYTVTALRLTGLFRFGQEDMSFDVGPQININDGIQPGLMLSGNKYFPVSDELDVALKLRIDVISGIVVYAPVSLNAGIRFKL